MAVRDASQKVTFIYTNLYNVYHKAKNSDPADGARILRGEEAEKVNIETFKPRSLEPVNEENAHTMAPRSNAFEDLRANINKLNDLHSRLRFMLKELEDLVGKK